ncbi:Pyruvate dehydrogenase E1 component [gamma proteobacterium IMCC1989]|nr:Pyruvate dehydrogenase E1 component [gamma proteobacterium IMCC1989]
MSVVAVNDQSEQSEELQEWLESLDYVLKHQGSERAKELLFELQNKLLGSGVQLDEATLNTPYRNTISVSEEPAYPGNIAVEKKIENIIRWNAMAMVLQAADSCSGVGGHIAPYASAATMLEVGFQHFFKNKSEDYGGDQVNVQAHAAPGVYARAFLEGRLDEVQLKNFRRQLQEGGGLSSYPHPRQLPDFWQSPTASMGLSTPNAIYQARFIKYLEARGLKPKNGGKIWNFIGDGEADEPEVLGTINIASREKLDNLILVINCNLQRLDGPVRGNGKVIQELERSFRGADWQVIKVIWGSGWDNLLARDAEGILQARMNEALDGDYQMYSVSEGDVQREHWVNSSPELHALMQTLTDEELREIKRGGQDPKKVHAAFAKAAQNSGKPTVVLVKTVKGDGMGAGTQGRNNAHQKKQLSREERITCGRQYGIPLSDDQLAAAEFYKPEADSEELQYLTSRRKILGGYLPQRKVQCPKIEPLEPRLFTDMLAGSGERAISTTMAVVRLIAKLLKDKKMGRYVVPIVPDEARTFGMEALFREAGIYIPEGQKYQPVDGDSLLPYKEAADGQILQEGICEAGAMASFLAAGTAYAAHGVPTIPFYIYYSMFGFQRVGDMIWGCADSMARGFLLGGTAGRTTLNGEGLQHQDGHSHLLAATVPNLRSYDPAFAYELAVIVRDGVQAMYFDEEKVFYYLTVYNENYPMPAIPEGEHIEDGIIKGAYLFKTYSLNSSSQKKKSAPTVNLLGSGSIMMQVMAAQALLAAQGVAVNIWSVTSYTSLSRDALDAERWNRLHPEAESQQSHIQQIFTDHDGVYVAASDYMKALPESIAHWMPDNYTTLGTDGFGISESREDLRDHFEVSAQHIAYTALYRLHKAGAVTVKALNSAMVEWNIDCDKPNPAKDVF